jgi:hypothetical protein
MATKLNALLIDPDALEGGVWIKPWEDLGIDVELLVKASDRAFEDAEVLAYRKLLRRAKEEGVIKNNKQGFDGLPPSTVQRVKDELMLSRLVLGVKNLESEKGPVTIQDFRELALTDQGANMLRMAREAVALVTERRAADREEALGNSAPSRPITSDGAASQA